MFKNIRHNGFTIVELLIVIVVIGVLATITIVAYNGISGRANDVKRASALDQYVKVLTIYKLQNGVYPGASGSTYCLGAMSHFPAQGEMPEGVCRMYATKTGSTVTPDTPTVTSLVTGGNINTEIASVAGSIPDASYQINKVLIEADPDNNSNGYYLYSRGPEYRVDTSTEATISYIIMGDEGSCPHGNKVYEPSVKITQCVIELH